MPSDTQPVPPSLTVQGAPRPPRKQTTAPDIASTNSTSNLFLGKHSKKPWMSCLTEAAKATEPATKPGDSNKKSAMVVHRAAATNTSPSDPVVMDEDFNTSSEGRRSTSQTLASRSEPSASHDTDGIRHDTASHTSSNIAHESSAQRSSKVSSDSSQLAMPPGNPGPPRPPVPKLVPPSRRLATTSTTVIASSVTSSHQRASSNENPGTRITERAASTPRISYLARTPPLQATGAKNENFSRLQSMAEAIFKQSGQTEIDVSRLMFLGNCCNLNDVDALLMHQLYMIWIHDRDILSINLGFRQHEVRDMRFLEILFGPDRLITPDLSRALLNFPESCDVLRTQPFRPSIERMKRALSQIGQNWYVAVQTCTTRGFPPCIGEIYNSFGPLSGKLQQVIFTRLCEIPGMCSSMGQKQAVYDAFTRMQLQSQHSILSLEALEAEVLSWRNVCNDAMTPQSENTRMAVRTSASGVQPAPSTTEAGCPYSTRAAQPTVTMGDHAQPHTFRLAQQQPAHAPVRATNTTSPSSGMHERQYLPGPLRQNPRQIVGGRSQNTSVGWHRLLPPPGYIMPMAIRPNPDRVALHQVLLRSPTARVVDDNGQQSSSLQLHQVVRRVLATPVSMTLENMYEELSFDVPPEEFDRKIQYSPARSALTPGFHNYKEGALLWRLRGISRESSLADAPSESEFCAHATYWPEHLFVMMNGESHIGLQRKQHHGRCLSAWLDAHLRPGINIITMSYDEARRKNPTEQRFWVAVELVEVVEQDTLRSGIAHTPRDVALSQIVKSMLLPSCEDDDLSIITPTISVDVIDPFRSTIWDVPVRGRTCKHRECFDLDTFISTRTRLHQDGPFTADEWKCPHCGKDARPQNLAIDGFLLDVREELRSQAMEDVRAILVHDDGTWEIKEEKVRDNVKDSKEESRGDGANNERSKEHPMSNAATDTASSEREVIMILDEDDDDDDNNDE